jgi:hypothetical protein
MVPGAPGQCLLRGEKRSEFRGRPATAWLLVCLNI